MRKPFFLELLDDVSDGVFLDRVGLNDGESALQCFHKISCQFPVLSSQLQTYKAEAAGCRVLL